MLLTVGAFGGAVRAQDVTGEPIVSGTVILDPIIVNARKIEEEIQRIPFGITVFGPDSIADRNIGEVNDFARDTPGLNAVDVGLRGGNIPNIRGVGSFFPQSPDDASVPVFIDGVPLPVRAQDRELFDVQQIEVLRGPQNSLYGRNAQAGAINITTVSPTFEPSFEARGEFGNQQHRQISAIASGPLTETLAGRIGAQFRSRDGDIPDLSLGDSARDQELTNATGKLLWVPGDATDVTLAVRYGKYDEQPTQGVWGEDPDFPRQFLDTAAELQTETIGAGLTVRHDFGGVNLTTVSGLQRYNSVYRTDDSDGLAFSSLFGLPPVFFNNPNVDFRRLEDTDLQLSQEVRLDGELENGTRWVAGINVFRADFDFDVIFNSSSLPLFGDFANQFTTTSVAGFGEVTVPLSDRMRAIAGLRYTYEVKDFDGTFVDLSQAGPIARATESDSETFNLVTGRAALSYDILPDLTGFVSVARGAKSGGFQLLDTDVTRGFAQSRFDSAFTWSYETGVRGVLFDGIWDVSASAFFNDTKDEHVQVFDFTTFEANIQNIDTQTYGIELETTVRPVTGLTLTGGVALLDTEITASEDPTVQKGNEVPFAPQVTFNIAGQYDHSVKLMGTDGKVYGRVEYQYVGSRTVDPQNSFDLESHDLVNLRAGWKTDNISVHAFVTNLFDESYAETAFLFGNSVVTGNRVSLANPGQPRLFGVGAKVRF
ncbi:MAG: TonB-dependent receptor [Pseudomonadota bacterium]